MVTKLPRLPLFVALSYVLAKIQMVTKHRVSVIESNGSYVLAKIQMVTKQGSDQNV